MKKIRVILVYMAAAIFIAVTMTACGSGASTAAQEAYPASDGTDYNTSGEGTWDGGEDDWAYDNAAEEWDGEYEMVPEEAAEGIITQETSVTVGNPDASRKIIITVDLHMESIEYDKSVSAIYAAIDKAEGYVENSHIQGSIDSVANIDNMTYTPMGGDWTMLGVSEDYDDEYYSYQYSGNRSMSMCIRVPKENLSALLVDLEASGNVLSKQEQAQDVTLEYTDVESHKKVLEAEQDRLVSMIEQAETVEEMIQLEERLSVIRYQIESYESRLRTYDNKVDYATVNIYMSEVIVYTEKPVDPIPDPTVGERISMGLQSSLDSIATFWTDLFVWFVVNIIYIAVTVIIIVLLIVFLRKPVKGWIKKSGEYSSAAYNPPVQPNAPAAPPVTPPAEPLDEGKKNSSSGE